MKKLIVVFILLISSGTSAQWVQLSNGMGTNRVVTSLTYNGNYLFAGTYSGVYRNVNDTWSRIGLTNKSVTALASISGNIFAGLSDSGLFVSTNSGFNWTQTSLGVTGISYLYANGNNLYAVTNQYCLAVSSNNGNNWTYLLTNELINTVAASVNKICVGCLDKIMVSSNNGANWNSTDVYNTVLSVAIKGNYIFAGVGSNGLYVSTNNGIQWQTYATDISTILAFCVSGNNLFVGKSDYPQIAAGTYLTTDNGHNWINLNQGFYGLPAISCLLIVNDYIYAGAKNNYTDYNAVWKRPISEIIGIQSISTEIHTKYSISQNYPNPFNPSTKIKFSIPENRKLKTDNSVVTLKVYDILGKEAATLVNEKLQPGTYEVNWNAANYPSGVYYYKLTSGDFSDTKRMILIK
ncbi:MAG: T9SS type A sorting domain-containing protein [Ignavibacteria bacterium]|nr:T9SS type A sorting domain-containing protein [Ignavibacteria bacterium]